MILPHLTLVMIFINSSSKIPLHFLPSLFSLKHVKFLLLIIRICSTAQDTLFLLVESWSPLFRLNAFHSWHRIYRMFPKVHVHTESLSPGAFRWLVTYPNHSYPLTYSAFSSWSVSQYYLNNSLLWLFPFWSEECMGAVSASVLVIVISLMQCVEWSKSLVNISIT